METASRRFLGCPAGDEILSFILSLCRFELFAHFWNGKRYLFDHLFPTRQSKSSQENVDECDGTDCCCKGTQNDQVI
jgi:hypothetical protein